MKLLNLKMSEIDLKEITELANEWTKGNVSAWIRTAARRYRPKKGATIKARGTSRPKVKTEEAS